MDTFALDLQHVTKRYATHLAVDDLSLSVPAGTIYGILGPNGAGKSTTLRMVMNIIARDSGSIRVLGADPATDRGVVRRIGYLPEERGLYKKMRTIDVIVFFAALHGMRESDARAEGIRWLEHMGLGQWQRSKVETLSKGMQQKLQFITAVIHHPEVLILDEPGSGLDPVNQEVLRETIFEARREGRTVVFSTHNMAQAESLCDFVCIIARGRKVLDGSLTDIRRSHSGHKYRIYFETVTPAVLSLMQNGLSGDRTSGGDGWELELPSQDAVSRTLTALASADVHVARFERVRPTLHQIFVEHVGIAETAARQEGVAGA